MVCGYYQGLHEAPLDAWNTPELAAHAYNAKAIELFKDRACLNSPEDRDNTQFLAWKDTRICFKAQEKEHSKSRCNTSTPKVRRRSMDPQVV